MIHSTSEQLNRHGNEHFSRGSYTEAYVCYAKALECDRLSGDRRALAATLGNLGNICAVSGRRERAQVYYQEVLELQKILGDDRGIGTTLANLGNLRADAGEWDRARAYYLEALDIMQKVGDEAGLAVLYSDLGLVARETGQCDEALRYYEQSLRLMRRLDNRGGIADAWRMIGRTYAMQHKYDEAVACCRTSQAVAERGGDELRAGGARYVMVQCYEELGRLQDAADLLEQVVQMDRKYHLPKLEENAKRLEVLRARLAQAGPSASLHGGLRT
ncbi:MAG: tetratricopeptide repeat protein [Nitrospirae bacterium]|nr:MAG: tetratricopeptide repeat protein [Nitrospirota bacterium]